MKKEAANIKKEVEEDFGTGKFAKYQKCLWDLIEKPHTSTAAKVRSSLMYTHIFMSRPVITISSLDKKKALFSSHLHCGSDPKKLQFRFKSK